MVRTLAQSALLVICWRGWAACASVYNPRRQRYHEPRRHDRFQEVTGDPAKDISMMSKVAFVMKDGAVVRR